MPWIGNVDKFKYFSAIITSKGYSTSAEEYKTLMKMNEQPIGFEETYCIMPFIDLCKHNIDSKNIENLKGKYKPGYATFSHLNNFNKGDNFEYSYTNQNTNENFVMLYGFYIENNTDTSTYITITFTEEQFNSTKVQLCKSLNCMPDTVINELTFNNVTSTYKIYYQIFPDKIPNSLIALSRIITIPYEKIIDNKEKVLKLIGQEKFNDYYDEINNWIFLRRTNYFNLIGEVLSYVSYFIQQLRKTLCIHFRILKIISSRIKVL